MSYLSKTLFRYVRQAFYFLTLPWVIRDKTDLGLLGYIHIFVRLNWFKFEGSLLLVSEECFR